MNTIVSAIVHNYHSHLVRGSRKISREGNDANVKDQYTIALTRTSATMYYGCLYVETSDVQMKLCLVKVEAPLLFSDTGSSP
jgi:hypothetical protein